VRANTLNTESTISNCDCLPVIAKYYRELGLLKSCHEMLTRGREFIDGYLENYDREKDQSGKSEDVYLQVLNIWRLRDGSGERTRSLHEIMTRSRGARNSSISAWASNYIGGTQTFSGGMKWRGKRLWEELGMPQPDFWPLIRVLTEIERYSEHSPS